MPSWHCHLKYSNLCVHHPETAKLLTAPLLSDLWAWSVSDSQPTSTQICQPASPMPGWLPGVSQRKRAHSPDSFDSVPPAVAEWAVHCDGSNATAQIVATNKKIWNVTGFLERTVAQASLLPFGSDLGAGGVLWSPSSSALILQSQAYGQAGKTPWVSVGTITIFPWEQEESLCMALLPQSRGLWQSVIYRSWA